MSHWYDHGGGGGGGGCNDVIGMSPGVLYNDVIDIMMHHQVIILQCVIIAI